jgi:hypothetical protein
MPSKPQIIMGGYEGHHNTSEETSERLRKGKAYEDLSTVCVIPTRGVIPARSVENWMGLIQPMNHPVVRMFISGMEVGAAYTAAVETILAHEVLKDFKFMLTLEEDNLPPPDGLLKLYESIEDYAVVSGLYYTKGEGGQPQIYGRPGELPMFKPMPPVPDTVQECNGLGMGFDLFRLDTFKDEKIPKPWFETIQKWDPNEGGQGFTQDLKFFHEIKKLNYKVACDTRVKVGHLDTGSGIVW